MRYLLIFFALVVGSCSSNKQTEQANEPESETAENSDSKDINQFPELLQKALDAHGDLATWNNYGYLSYQLKSSGNVGPEKHTINLYNRKVLIDRDTVNIGFNGDQVWVSPDLASFGSGSPRFYHNLYFYFFGIPFLLADPGINYEDLGTRTIQGKDYRALKVSYSEGVGDSDEDLYIAHFNPETYQLEILLYTVTYFSGEKTEDYNALIYDDWVKRNGLVVPAGFKGHKYANDSIGDLRYDVKFSNIEFKKATPSKELFEMPANAEVDSLKSN